MNSINATVRAFIAENFYVPDAEGIRDDASLLGQGIIDSTGMLELTAFLEREYAMTVGDAEIIAENLDTIARITAFVERKRASEAA